MAHGAYLMTGLPQAVMVHVNVGTANTINNLTNLSRDRARLTSSARGPHADHRRRVRSARARDRSIGRRADVSIQSARGASW